ncbi:MULTISPECIES: alpha/beta fold hydrolase [Streptomyces]|uniref:alpha/beta fold hydrolase n=1 Tax=Streptomyces TaxID=1883 RepID=UPI00081B05AB|nr:MULTISPECIES: alpha/beta hydrolase [unclassified Streptomyces]MYQ52463.1 alpha/beta fold hydrolase [Streptomyces sp. SID4941]SCD82928.1 Pimeloyl-ACP methyl ester carboxylesterase [Streptomyces sp. PalvLS-984]SDC34614.1 Pimeloyl-ACP methyl ester carboxylesterase [Streptomyces sp. AmelKG-A3]
MQQPAPASGTSASASGAAHRLVDVPGGRIHLVEQGTGPLVLLIHGFPETSYSWRHQLPVLAEAGFRAVAVDVRGYGRSSAPDAVEDYRMTALVADNVAVLKALGEETATVVGHDWGSSIAADSALLRPDLFTAAAFLSVPYSPWNPVRPTEGFARIGGDEEFYVSYFQEPGRAEAEIEPDVRGWLAGFYTSLSAGTMPPADQGSPFFVPAGARMRDRFARGPLPSWLTEEDLDVYSAEFERTGLTGGLNRYRNVDRDWEDLAAWDGARLTQPALFIGGSLDSSTTWMADAIAAYPDTLPGLVSSHIIEGCGHWIQQERAAEVNDLLVRWLRTVHG